MLLFYYKDAMDEGHSIIYYTCNKGICQKTAIKNKKSSIQKLQNN